MPINSFTRRDFIGAAGIGGLALLSHGYTQSPDAVSPSLGIRTWAIRDGGVVVPPGVYHAGAQRVRVSAEQRLEIEPTDVVNVSREPLFLSAKKPQGFFVGTMLRGPKTETICAMHSLIPASVKVTDASGRLLELGRDYLLSAPFALLGIGPDSRVTPATEVYASYAYYTQRIDSIIVDGTGTASLIRGEPHLFSPPLPGIPGGTVRICNVYRPFRARTLGEEHLFPITSTATDAVTATTLHAVPRTMEKIKAGQPVKIVCWGDSITVGANVTPEEAWANRLRVALAERFPQARFSHANHSIGGSKSAQWVYNGNFPGLPQQNPEKCRFDHVLNEKPDLVVMEFLNDIVLAPDAREQVYRTISDQFKSRGIEWIINTPSQKIPESYDLREMKTPTPRGLDTFLEQFARENGHALADAAARWRHLHVEGIPYFSMFNNAYNHPNARGHELFVEEILKCFDA